MICRRAAALPAAACVLLFVPGAAVGAPADPLERLIVREVSVIGPRVLVPFVDLVRIDVAWEEPGQGATASLGISLKTARQRQRVR